MLGRTRADLLFLSVFMCLFLSEVPQTLRVRHGEDVSHIVKARGRRTTCNTISVPVKSSLTTVTAQNRNISPKIHLIIYTHFAKKYSTKLDLFG